ncbi:hypothetical protein KKG36_01955, partial [Patescibacteria group bacterium]|nr:hypothetical protein [Patescibacteria group bacterium]
MGIIEILAIFFVLLFLSVIIAFYFEKKDKGTLLESLGMSLFLVMMPKSSEKKNELMGKEEKTIIGQMEQFFANFLYLTAQQGQKGVPRIALEIASQIGNTDISFYIAVPLHLETALEKYVHGVYPGALVEKIPQDYTVFEPGGVTFASYLKLKESPIFPISTYVNLEKDPLSALTNTLSKISNEEGAAIQVVIRPARQDKWRKLGQQVLEKLQEGKPLKAAMSEFASTGSALTKDLTRNIDYLVSTTSSKESSLPERRREQVVDQRSFDAIKSKIQKQAFETNIRL